MKLPASLAAFAGAAFAGAILAASPASAAPNVVATIKPVHSLVAGVMEGIGTPALIVGGAGSPHAYSLKPSQARDLEGADLVFWIGHGLEAFLEKPIETLGSGATVIELGDAEGLTRLETREGGAFEPHDHDHEAGEEADAGQGHEETTAGEGHDHDETDMHLWLDPQNAGIMVRSIAEALAAADPVNAERYEANAEAMQARLEALTDEIGDTLAPVRGRPFIVFHDAYHYFENRFDIEAAGSITVTPDVMPGAARVSQIREKLRSTHAACVFAEPQFEPKLISVVTEGTDARAGVLDPLGAGLEPGPGLYPELLRNLARSLRDCLADAS